MVAVMVCVGADLPFQLWSGGGSWGPIVREPKASRPRDLICHGELSMGSNLFLFARVSVRLLDGN